MASSDIRQFNWYDQYLVSATDMTNFQQWIFNTIGGLAEGTFGGAILSGLNVIPNGGLNMSIPAGIAVSPSGKLIVVGATTAAVTSPVANPSRTLIVLRPKQVDTTPIAQPTMPTNTVFLHETQSYDVVVLNGVAGASPVYPSTLADDIVICGLKLTSGVVTVTQSMIDRSVFSVNGRGRVAGVSAAYTVLITDRMVEGDCTSAGFTATLPDPTTVPGKMFTFVKVDSSANALTIAAAALISGQSTQVIDDQWGSLTVYSNGVSYRAIV